MFSYRVRPDTSHTQDDVRLYYFHQTRLVADQMVTVVTTTVCDVMIKMILTVRRHHTEHRSCASLLTAVKTGRSISTVWY